MKFILYLYCGYLYCVNCKNAYHNIRLAYAIIIHYTRFLSREQQIFSYNEHKKLRIIIIMRQSVEKVSRKGGFFVYDMV